MRPYPCEGVPTTMIMDRVKEQVQGQFRKTLLEAWCHIKLTEPYSP